MRPRIAVTGVGTFCSVARSAADFTEALRDGRRGLVELGDPRLDGLRATHAGLIGEVIPDEGDPASVRCLDRNVHLALRAMREALSCAGLEGPLGDDSGVVFGTCSGGMLSIESHYRALVGGEDPIDEDLLFSKRYYTTAKILAWAAGIRGPVLSVVTACAAGTGAIAQAADLIRAGLATRVIAGGSDSFAASTLVGFDALKATTEGLCAPFSNPIGLNLGEGAAFLVLERLEDAIDRGAVVMGEILGSGLSNDAYHPTAPDPSARGQLAAMGAAVADAGITPDDIHYINAHGTGTRANDPAESRAISRMLGDRASRVPVSSTKSMIGHCLGGAGALESSATLLAARAGFFPPTAGFCDPREGCDLDYVPDAGRPWVGRLAMSNSFGFAGNNACLVLDVSPDSEGPISPLPEPSYPQVVITGAGLITPRGMEIGAMDGETAIGPIDRFPSPAPDFLAGLVPDLDVRNIDRRLDLKGMDLCSRYAAMATRQALTAAGIKPRPRNMENVGLILGISTGPGEGEAMHLKSVFESDFDLQRLGHFPYVVPNEVAGNVARAMMIKGHSTVLATGPGAGLAAAISAYTAVKLGHCETVMAIASDELTERSCLDGYKVGLWGSRSGVAPAEGSAVVVVEDAKVARSRGASPLAVVLGCSLATDISDPRQGDRAAALERALEDLFSRTGVPGREVDAVGLACSGSGDDERAMVEKLFREGLVPVSTSSVLGHADACGPLFDLVHLTEAGSSGSVLVVAFTSPEGLAGAMMLRLL